MLTLLCAVVLTQQQAWQVWAQPIVDASAAVRTGIPVVDQVVLVPDLPTLLDELGRWSPQGHWPILIESEPLNDLFIRRFRPGRVLRRERVAAAADQAAVETAVARAWDLDSGPVAVAAAKVLGTPVPGIVLSDPKSSARAAAALLAAGRGQYLGWVTGDYGRSGKRLSAAQGATLTKAVEAACAETGVAWSTLGDAIDTVTLCRDLAARIDGGERIGSDNAQNPPALAVTDVIGRHSDGRRWAFTGWIFGTAGHSAFMANCSLFLPRSKVWLGDTYPNRDPWSNWKLSGAAQVLRENGYQVALTSPLTPDALTMAGANGLAADLIMVVSKGNADFFRLAGELDVDAAQVPVLVTPAAVYMLHSWSLRSPNDVRTVGGRWIANGAYATVGSSQEPSLNAFVPGELIVKRLTVGIPWLIAGRFWPGEGGPASNPWRINTIGDPLMIAPPPGTLNRRKIKAPDDIPAGCVNIATEAKEALKAAASAPSDALFATAITGAVRSGRDALAVQMYAAAQERSVAGPQSSAAVLEAAVFEGDAATAAAAAGRLPVLDRRHGDLLWAVGAPLLMGHPDADLVSLLEQTIDPRQSAGRVRLMAAYLKRTQGPLAATVFVQRFLDRATSNRQIRELKKLL